MCMYVCVCVCRARKTPEVKCVHSVLKKVLTAENCYNVLLIILNKLLFLFLRRVEFI